MRAILFEAAGEPVDVLQFKRVDRPQVAPGAVRVAVSRRPIQPADLAFIRGRYRVRPAFPQIAGLEGAGVIAEVPDGSGFAVGERVAFRAPGAWADEAIVPLERLIRLPDDIGDDDGCQIALNPITAWALLEQSGAKAGDALLLTAATSTVAGLVAALARSRGIRTIGVVRGDADGARDRCGAAATVSADEAQLVEAIVSAAQGRPVTALVDSVGGPQVARLIPALAPGGRIIAYGVMDSAPAPVTNAMLIYANLSWIGFGIDRWLDTGDAATRTLMIDELWSALRAGSLRLPVAGRFALEDVVEAIRADATPGRTGKIVLT